MAVGSSLTILGGVKIRRLDICVEEVNCIGRYKRVKSTLVSYLLLAANKLTNMETEQTTVRPVPREIWQGIFRASLTIILTLTLTTGAARAATITWDGEAGGSDMNWSTASNWDPDTADVTANDIIFTNTAVSGTAGTVNNIVSADCAVNSLVYNQINLYHTTQIDASRTLTVNGSFVAGIPVGSFGTNTVTIKGSTAGAGTMIINAGANNVVIGPNDANYNNGTRLN